MAKEIKLLVCKQCGAVLTAEKSRHFEWKKNYFAKKGKTPLGPFCCVKCAMNNSEIKALREKTILEKYGVKNVSQSKDIQKKKEQTCLKNYGVLHPYQSQQIQQKHRRTVLRKYGVDNISKIAKTKEVKIKKALEKYGVTNVFQSEEIKKKSRQTCLKKYGVENYAFSYKKRLKSYNSVIKRNVHCKVLFSLQEWQGTTTVAEYRVKCNLCGKEYIARSKCNYLSLCPECSVSGRSYKEKALVKFIKENTPFQIKTTDRKILKGCGKNGGCLELDIVIPELKLAFQFNGNYWHKQGDKKEKGYHDYKTKCCLERGFRLVHIWECDWDNDNQKIKNMIKEMIK